MSAPLPDRTIWLHPEREDTVCVLDQRQLPHRTVVVELTRLSEMATAIAEMYVRGAPLIGAAAAWGMYLAARTGRDITEARRILGATRPTAVDLFHALDRSQVAWQSASNAVMATRAVAEAIVEESVQACYAIGLHGLPLLEQLARKRNGQPVQVLTHCNAGRLACIAYGTATAPIYLAHEAGVPLQVWVGETRPRNQGGRLTACELAQAGIPHTIITDNAGGLLMQQGQVDIVLLGSDRTTRHGDVANKIGTYLKALAASDNGIPFYVALPSSSIDWSLDNGLQDIPIEYRDPAEVTHISGWSEGALQSVRLTPADSPAWNPAFDVTPARLVTGLITERGIAAASAAGLRELFPDKQIE